MSDSFDSISSGIAFAGLFIAWVQLRATAQDRADKYFERKKSVLDRLFDFHAKVVTIHVSNLNEFNALNHEFGSIKNDCAAVMQRESYFYLKTIFDNIWSLMCYQLEFITEHRFIDASNHHLFYPKFNQLILLVLSDNALIGLIASKLNPYPKPAYFDPEYARKISRWRRFSKIQIKCALRELSKFLKEA